MCNIAYYNTRPMKCWSHSSDSNVALGEQWNALIGVYVLLQVIAPLVVQSASRKFNTFYSKLEKLGDGYRVSHNTRISRYLAMVFKEDPPTDICAQIIMIKCLNIFTHLNEDYPSFLYKPYYSRNNQTTTHIKITNIIMEVTLLLVIIRSNSGTKVD